jgi:hypothetical protein
VRLMSIGRCGPASISRVRWRIPILTHVKIVAHRRKCCLPLQPRCGGCCIRQFCNAGKRQLAGVPLRAKA